jgi:hypothetical protein
MRADAPVWFNRSGVRPNTLMAGDRFPDCWGGHLAIDVRVATTTSWIGLAFHLRPHDGVEEWSARPIHDMVPESQCLGALV